MAEDITFSNILIKEILENQRTMNAALADVVKRPELEAIIKRLDAAVSRETLDERWRRMDDKIDALSTQVGDLIEASNNYKASKLPSWLSNSAVYSSFAIVTTLAGTVILHFVFHI